MLNKDSRFVGFSSTLCGFIKIIRLKSNFLGKTRPYNVRFVGFSNTSLGRVYQNNSLKIKLFG
ncbi:MAG TPA: hypothetical protein DCZ55_11465 [Cyanobacteria bacterium UBA11371]|nr:hypothetical protein [Cyanobacteria bacterium UBA11371]HBE37001.1 hypothetical protein [Cyanobacteria bacterium UBA11368]